jgi:hypothetical protein
VGLPEGFIVVLLAVGLIATIARMARDQRRLRLRAEWGQPRPKPRRMDDIRASHRSRATAPGAAPVLDDRRARSVNTRCTTGCAPRLSPSRSMPSRPW